MDRYRIKLDRQLDRRWLIRFDGFEMEQAKDGTTILVGDVVDQAALHGVLTKLRDLGVPIASFVRIPDEDLNTSERRGK